MLGSLGILLPGGCGVVALGLADQGTETGAGFRAGFRQIRDAVEGGMTVIQPGAHQLGDRVVRIRGIGVSQAVRYAGLEEEIIEAADIVRFLQAIEGIEHQAQLAVSVSDKRVAAFGLGRGHIRRVKGLGRIFLKLGQEFGSPFRGRDPLHKQGRSFFQRAFTVLHDINDFFLRHDPAQYQAHHEACVGIDHRADGSHIDALSVKERIE